jgi:cysteinyl-tRNA synthetase
MRSGNRDLKVTGADQKQDPLDFVLWKPKKEGEPYWDCPWCKGRPGWHIECSVMSKRYLGDQIDIHAGGEDLVFPHHENEIAQSEAANGVTFAKYWMHNAFLNIDGEKMAKSKGNFFTVRDIISQYDPQVLRYFMLSSHYRSPLNFSRELMEAARASYERILNCGENLRFLSGKAQGSLTEEEAASLAEAESYRKQFEAAMDDDFNTADGISAVFELVKWINSRVSGSSSSEFIEKLSAELHDLTDVCGLIIERDNELEDDLAAYVEAKIEERKAAKKARDFAKADAIRDELKEKGIILEDTREGVKWKKV